MRGRVAITIRRDGVHWVGREVTICKGADCAGGEYGSAAQNDGGHVLSTNARTCEVLLSTREDVKVENGNEFYCL